MDATDARKRRLHGLIDLARASRGWSKAQLAKVLERDPTKLYPESGNPKADFLIKLAEVLEWPVADLIETVWGPQLPGAAAAVGAEKSEPKPAVGAGSYEELFGQARSAHQKGDYRQVVSLSRLMYSVASNEDHKAVACSVEASGWDGLGRYVQEVEACKRGLQHRPENPIRRNQLRAVLANAWYSLWELTPALGTAELLANWYEKNPPKTDLDWKRPAFVHYVRGHTHRRMAFTEPELRQEHLLAAEADLKQSAEMHESLSIKLNAPQLAGIANTCRGGLLEIDVELGRRNAADTINEIVAKVDAADIGQATGDWLESHGWWCIFGSDLAVRHLKGRELQETTRHLTSKALAIADKANNWAMRERVFTLQFALHQTITDLTGLDIDFPINDSDKSLITATMGRFPSFRSVGWQILETAKVVPAKQEGGR